MTHEGLCIFRGTARLLFGISGEHSTADAVELNVKSS